MKLSRTVLFMMATAAATFSYADDPIPADASAAATTIEATSPTDEIMTPISFIANGGEGTMEILYLTEEAPEQALTLCAYTREGYTFYGWALSADGDPIYADGATVKFEKATDLYACWAKNSYKIKFKANEGGKGKMKAKKMDFTNKSKLPKNAFTKKGCIFAGWALSKKGAVVYKDQEKVAIPTDGSVTLYARWIQKNYKVKFYANGGKGKMASQKMVYGKKAQLAANKFKRSGYTFKGWARSKADAAAGNKAYKNKKSVKNIIKTGSTVKLYAVWAPIAE